MRLSSRSGGRGFESRRMAGLLIALSTLLGTAVSAEVDREVALRDMREIFAGIRVLLPLSADDQAFRSAARRAEILAAFDRIAAGAAHASDHIAGDDQRIRFLAGGLSDATREAKARFQRADYAHAQFMVHRFTDFCIACHTRVPSLADSPLAQGFVSDKAIAKLPAASRASILVATRRFDDALATYEELFASSTLPAELLEPLSEYLRVAIRVKHDIERARATLEKFAARSDLWSVLRRDVQGWLAALEGVSPQTSKTASVARAREFLTSARSARRYPLDARSGMIQRDLAASELHRYLEKHAGEKSLEVAEAYYLLGRIEGEVPFGHVISESDFYLETAVRLAPADAIGREAFDLYEERAILGWTGSGGTRLPAEVKRKLDELRELVQSQPAAN